MKGLYEILTERKWMVLPEFAHGIRKALEQNFNTHAAFVKPEKTCGFVTAVAADGTVYYPEENGLWVLLMKKVVPIRISHSFPCLPLMALSPVMVAVVPMDLSTTET